MKRIYSCIGSVHRMRPGGGIIISAQERIFIAESEYEAIGRATKSAEEDFPVSDGWNVRYEALDITDAIRKMLETVDRENKTKSPIDSLKANRLDVGVDCHDYTPILLEDAIKLAKGQKTP